MTSNNQNQPSRTHIVHSKFLSKSKQVDIYLPEGYNHQNTYHCVFMNDGQDAAAMNIQTTAHDLVHQKLIPPFIWVAIHAGHNRLREYGVAGYPDFAGRGDLAGDYSLFITRELFPLMKSLYRISTNPLHNAFLGMSLGGLSALDIAWNQHQLFGHVGVCSGAFWWRRRDLDEQYTAIDRIMHRTLAISSQKPELDFWFEAGTLDETFDRNQNGIIDSIEDTLDIIQILRYKGYALHSQIRYLEIAGGKHNQETWSASLPDFLLWAFGDRKRFLKHL